MDPGHGLTFQPMPMPPKIRRGMGTRVPMVSGHEVRDRPVAAGLCDASGRDAEGGYEGHRLRPHRIRGPARRHGQPRREADRLWEANTDPTQRRGKEADRATASMEALVARPVTPPVVDEAPEDETAENPAPVPPRPREVFEEDPPRRRTRDEEDDANVIKLAEHIASNKAQAWASRNDGPAPGVPSEESVWETALVEASLRYEDDRLKVEIEGRAARELMDKAFANAEVAIRENEALKSRAAAMEVEMAALRKRVSDLVAEEFWDRVMHEIADVLPEDDWVADRQVLRLLPPSLAREAITRGDDLTRGRLNRKMGIRVTHTKYFESEDRDDGSRWYRRKQG